MSDLKQIQVDTRSPLLRKVAEVNQLSRRIEEEGLSPESPVPALV